MRYLRWFLANSKGIRLSISVRIMAGLLQTVLALLVVWMSKRLIDDVALTGTTGEMAVQASLLALAVVAGVTIRQFNQYLANKAYINKVAELRLTLFSLLFRRKLFENNELHSGDVSSRMAKDIDTVSETMAVTLPQVVVMTMQLLGAFLLMRWFDHRLAWALILITPLAVGIGKFVSHKLRKITLAIREDESRILARIQESAHCKARDGCRTGWKRCRTGRQPTIYIARGLWWQAALPSDAPSDSDICSPLYGVPTDCAPEPSHSV